MRWRTGSATGHPGHAVGPRRRVLRQGRSDQARPPGAAHAADIATATRDVREFAAQQGLDEAEALAKGILAGNPQLTQLDFDRAMVELRDRNMISADPIKLDSRFKAEIRHAQG